MTRRPTTPRFGVINVAWQLGQTAAAVHTGAAAHDVLGLVECRTRGKEAVDVARILGDGWLVFQDLTDSATAGTAIALRKMSGCVVRKATMRRISDAGHHATAVQARYEWTLVLLEPDGSVDEVTVGHNPLVSTGRQGQAIAHGRRWATRASRRIRCAVLRRRWVWMGDPNLSAAKWAQHLNAPHHYGVRPMAIVWSSGWGSVATMARRVKGSDHAMLTLQRLRGPR